MYIYIYIKYIYSEIIMYIYIYIYNIVKHMVFLTVSCRSAEFWEISVGLRHHRLVIWFPQDLRSFPAMTNMRIDEYRMEETVLILMLLYYFVQYLYMFSWLKIMSASPFAVFVQPFPVVTPPRPWQCGTSIFWRLAMGGAPIDPKGTILQWNTGKCPSCCCLRRILPFFRLNILEYSPTSHNF